MNAADAATATIIAKGYGDEPMSLATAIATGAINTAVAVLDTNKPIAAVTMKRPASNA